MEDKTEIILDTPTVKSLIDEALKKGPFSREEEEEFYKDVHAGRIPPDLAFVGLFRVGANLVPPEKQQDQNAIWGAMVEQLHEKLQQK